MRWYNFTQSYTKLYLVQSTPSIKSYYRTPSVQFQVIHVIDTCFCLTEALPSQHTSSSGATASKKARIEAPPGKFLCIVTCYVLHNYDCQLFGTKNTYKCTVTM